ncbi:ligand-binding protein SH3 [Brevibacterium permense]|uniref:ligand-binding protein SH3 n=1 Tax=Brevibacterium permense TaxID=234834 RepID=UPI0021D2A2A7|nr:ligand-binding protein SH3 [Brevibacterium permense]MCU4297798.1 ligand-binding protein SH3 [Brevibacterium permense]
MGKHSSPKPSFAKQLIRDLTPGKRPAGRRAANAPSSATSVLATVKQRPVVAAIAVPAAATAAVVGSTVVMGPPESSNVTTEAASTTPEESTTASTPSQKELDAERKKAGEEYLEKVKDDPKYKNKTSKTDLEVKAPPKPKPTAESSAASEKSDDSSSGDKSSDEKSSGGGTSSDTSAPPCSVSSSIESGLLPNAVNGYRAVCAKFPEVKTFGGRRPGTGSDHNTGEAVDIMITGSTGDRIADYLIQNQGALNVKYVIWKQRIWMPGQGWKGMEDRGDATANHFDHVHASFN